MDVENTQPENGEVVQYQNFGEHRVVNGNYSLQLVKSFEITKKVEVYSFVKTDNVHSENLLKDTLLVATSESRSQSKRTRGEENEIPVLESSLKKMRNEDPIGKLLDDTTYRGRGRSSSETVLYGTSGLESGDGSRLNDHRHRGYSFEFPGLNPPRRSNRIPSQEEHRNYIYYLASKVQQPFEGTTFPLRVPRRRRPRSSTPASQ